MAAARPDRVPRSPPASGGREIEPLPCRVICLRPPRLAWPTNGRRHEHEGQILVVAARDAAGAFVAVRGSRTVGYGLLLRYTQLCRSSGAQPFGARLHQAREQRTTGWHGPVSRRNRRRAWRAVPREQPGCLARGHAGGRRLRVQREGQPQGTVCLHQVRRKKHSALHAHEDAAACRVHCRLIPAAPSLPLPSVCRCRRQS